MILVGKRALLGEVRLVVVSVVAVLVGSTLVYAGGPVGAQPGEGEHDAEPAAAAFDPGTVIYEEGFDNRPADSNIALPDYVGIAGETYTADPYWLVREACNGFIINWSSPAEANDCAVTGGPASYLALTAVPHALGTYAGSEPTTNAAAVAYSAGSPTADSVQFRTADPLTLPDVTDRFLTFTVDVGVANCDQTTQQLQLFLDDGTTEVPLSSAPYDPCTDPDAVAVDAVDQQGTPQTVQVGTMTGDTPVLFPGGDIGIVLRNTAPPGPGGEGAYDNVRVVDVTPQVDKGFDPSQILAEQVSTMTLTITNTDELLAKEGWSFTDTLPSGVTVVDPGGAETDCPNGEIVAESGSGVVSVSGDLSAGMVSCTVTVSVTSIEPGTYQNCAGNFSDLVGVEPPQECAELVCEEGPTADLPDSFVNCPISTEPPPTDFTIAERWRTDAITLSYQTPVLGDLYGTGEPIAVVAGNDDYFGSGGVHVRVASGLRIVRAADGELLDTIETPRFGWSGHAVMAIGDVDDDGQGEIILKANHHVSVPVDQRGRLIAYRNDGTVMWVSDQRYDNVEGAGRSGASMGIADFNGDGVPEVYVGNQIFNAETGARVLAGGAGASAGCPYRAQIGCFWSQTTAVDVDGDGVLELLAGNVVYKVDIINPAGEAGNSITVWQQADPTVAGVGDGWTAVADLDLDGRGDQVVIRTSNNAQTGQTILYVWDPQTGEVKGILNGGIGTAGGPPMLGDIDGDGVPEIVFQNRFALRAFRLEAGGLVQLWAIGTNDGSGETSLSMFDFNSDGTKELVYRDEALLRIIDGSGDTAVNLATFPCASGTAVEMPVIADIDGSGEARILVTCAPSTTTNQISQLRAYETDSFPWAPTRPVWNQQAYFVTHVNDDLTIPDSQFSQWAVFEDPDGTCNTAGALNRPLNAFQQQTTTLDPETGCPVLCLTEADFGDAPDSYGTTLADDGARHVVPDHDESAGTAPLMLGTSIDIETDGFPSIGADGDNFDNLDDEEAVPDPIVVVPGETAQVSVTVTNDTPQPATLAGWIDLDGSGTFDPGERVTTQIPAAAGTGTYDLVFPAGAPTSNTYARFRLYPGTVADPSPTGLAAAGEVEDHLVMLAWVSYEKAIDPPDPVVLQPGDTFTYTVTVSNLGTVPLPGLSFTDDLTNVVDDATFVLGSATATIGTALFVPPDELQWTGDLDVGDVATVTYQVTIDDPPGGDATLINGVVGDGPATNCPPPGPPTAPECRTQVPQPVIETDKTLVSPDEPVAGDVVTYRFTVSNTGSGRATDQTITDDLPGVLDDAVYNDDAMADLGTVDFDVDTGQLVWTGTLDPGEEAVVTYSVTVNDPGSLGDGRLVNTVTAPGCPDPPIVDPDDPDFDPDCVTDTPVKSWTVEKTSDAADPVMPGDTLTYTISVVNDGAVELTGPDMAEVDDDLSHVLDDAAFVTGSESASQGTVTFTDPMLSWRGALPVRATVTIGYAVVVDDPVEGDFELLNAVTSNGPDCPAPAITDPDEPGFDPACVNIDPLPGVHYDKSITPPAETGASGELRPGDTFTYTIVVTNTGRTDLTGLSFVDDLSGVVDDGRYNEDAVATSGTVAYTAPELLWTGDLDIGETARVTYTVTVNDPISGDEILTNAVVGTGPNSNCAPPDPTDPACRTTFPGPVVDVVKRLVSPADPVAGDVVTYRIEAHNRGVSSAQGEVITDDLSGVLDDATYNDDAAVTAGTVSYSAPAITWTTDIAPDETVAMTYTVTIDPAAELGDAMLDNTVVGGATCPDPPVTDTDDPEFDADCLTATPIGAIEYIKTIAVPDGGTAPPGGIVTYQVVAINRGATSLTDVGFTDDLTQVLVNATYLDDAAATIGVVVYTAPLLSWSGDLSPGGSVSVTYSVRIDDPISGTVVLENFIVGDGPGSNCYATQNGAGLAASQVVQPPDDPDCRAELKVVTRLPTTGGNIDTTVGASLVALLAGAMLVALSRRRRPARDPRLSTSRTIRL